MMTLLAINVSVNFESI